MRLRSGLLACLAAALAAAPASAAEFAVTKTTDSADGACDADCSLREAILAANEAPSSVVRLPAGTYRLSLPRVVEQFSIDLGDGKSGNLLVDAPMTILGDGAGATVIDARPAEGQDGVDRVMAITYRGNPVAITGVTITGGRSTPSTLQGGGIFIQGGAVTVTDCDIVGNTALRHPGGGVGVTYGFSLEMGKIVRADVRLKRTTVRNNVAADDTLGSGGGICNQFSSFVLEDSTVEGNRAGFTGGGIWNQGNSNQPLTFMLILRSTIASNVAGLNGAGEVPLFGGVGGGVYAQHSSMTINNSTIALNEVRTGGIGGVPFNGIGGGFIHNFLGPFDPSAVQIVNSTIARNVARLGAQIHCSSNPDSKPAYLANTIVAGDGSAPNCGREPTLNVDFESYGGNLSSDASGCRFTDPTDKTATDPLLAPALADNGGETDTLALLDGSPALGAGVQLFCQPADQRGVARDAPCDIGAYERVDALASVKASLQAAVDDPMGVVGPVLPALRAVAGL